MTENKRTHSFAPMNRRQFVTATATVAGAAGLAGVLPDSLARAAAAAPRKFDLSQVKHLVFLMQENRSFDHYFGTFPGARGFNDPTAIKLPTGRSVFQQPDPANPDGYLEPYHMSTITTGAAAVPSLSHDWRDQHGAWNQGAMDGWLLTHLAADGDTNGSFTMGHYTEEDLPFHWALAKAFTLADNYHCSVMGPTDPNRLFWEHGTNDPQGLAGGPVLETGGVRDLTFETAPEMLCAAGISYKFYWNQGWLGPGDGPPPYFKQFQTPGLVPTALYNAMNSTGTLFGDGTPGGVGDPTNPTAATNRNLAFEEDCANGVLPDVSFIGTSADEHPPAIPAAGAQFLATKLEALAANEELWNTTVFIIDYDENDGFFDHVVPPTPDPKAYPEEFVTLASPAGTPGGGLPVGAGFRVPCFIISPWSVGGRIFSEVSDHTSCLRLVESVAAAGGLSGNGPVTISNISRWRRKTFSDFTGALRPVAPQPAPSNTQFDAATTAANLAAQQVASTQPMPARPGADQQIAFAVGPTSGLAIAPSGSAPVYATFSNNGPGSVSKIRLTLTAPSGWNVSSATATTATTLGNEESLTATWQVTAPATFGAQPATLSATASYTQAGATKTITAQLTTDTVVPDSGPAGYNGFATAAVTLGPDPTLPAGTSGYSATFDGAASTVTTTAPDLPAPWTVGAWVEPTDTSSSATLLTGPDSSIKLQQYNSTGLVGITEFGVADYTSGYTLPLNTWTYLTVVDNGTSATIYANGEQVSTIRASVSLGRQLIGTRDASDETFAKVGELTVFSGAFAAAQVAALYAAGGSGAASGLPGLVDDWTMAPG